MTVHPALYLITTPGAGGGSPKNFPINSETNFLGWIDLQGQSAPGSLLPGTEAEAWLDFQRSLGNAVAS